MKKLLFISLLCPVIFFGQELETKNISQNDDMFSKFMQLSQHELYDTANYYLKKNSYDTAFVYFNLFIKTIPQNADIEQQKKIVNANLSLSYIYGNTSNYRNAYELYIKTLLICEKYDLDYEKARIYMNIGAIYFYLNNYENAKKNYLKALDLKPDINHKILLLNNLGANEGFNNNSDSAFKYLTEAIKISKQHNGYQINSIYNNFGSYYQHEKQYDSAFYYFRLSLKNTIVSNDIFVETNNLSDIGKLFFELNQIDSALYYIGLANKIASENKFLEKLTENYLTLSKIEKSKGNFKKALNYYETYISLKDSISNAEVYGSINLIQQQYEVSKTNQQIEEYIISQQIKDNTIHYQKIIQRNTSTALVALIIVLGVVLLQNNKLRKAYKVLVDKNVEIVEMIDTSPNPSEIEASPYPSEGDTSPNPSEGGETDNYPSRQNSENPIPKPETLNSDVTETPNLQPETITDSSPLTPHPSPLTSHPSPLTSHPSPLTPEIEATDEEKEEKAPKKPLLSDDAAKELLDKIMNYMENHTEIYNFDFSIDTLADLIDSNHSYVSYIFNSVLKMKFRTFLNKYRIREAQRLFSEKRAVKYTVEVVANKVGYRSRQTFNEIFKESCGVTPALYMKSLKK